MAKKREDRSRDVPAEPFHSPFAALRERFGALPAGPSPTPEVEAEKASPNPRRAVLRYERKGRGGREVTLVEELGLSQEALGEWLKDLKSTLGCGGSLEGEALVFQGDQRERLKAALERRGVRRISVG